VAAPATPLPELVSVYWRRRTDERELRRAERLWTLTAVAHTIPFVGVAAALMALQPLAAPVAAMSLAQAWIIPALYAARGANVLRPKAKGDAAAERASLGLLGDLVGHPARELHARTGVVLERGAFGTWLVGEAGAVLVRPGGHRVHCYCVRVTDPELPSGDRIAHLLLALRADEAGFATVANRAFTGAPWRLRRRLARDLRPALDEARAGAREWREYA
jgi:hypothetical protein